MNASTHLGEYVPLYNSMPQNLADWAKSDDVIRTINAAACIADHSIAALNKERVVQPEKLHQPITL